MYSLNVVEGGVIAQFVSEVLTRGYADVCVGTYGIHEDVVTKEEIELDQALTNAWECGVSYEQAIELAPLMALSREEFVAAMNALDFEVEQALC